MVFDMLQFVVGLTVIACNCNWVILDVIVI